MVIQSIGYWIGCDENVAEILVGNKCDLPEKQISADCNDAKYFGQRIPTMQFPNNITYRIRNQWNPIIHIWLQSNPKTKNLEK